MMNLREIIEFDTQTQSFSATCPELNFVSSCGMTKEEAVKNLQEAIILMLEPIPTLHGVLLGYELFVIY
jgi:predicted RNase H-like HicB family nuclease